MAAIGSEVEGCEQIERGVVEVGGDAGETKVEEVGDDKDVKILEKSVRTLSL